MGEEETLLQKELSVKFDVRIPNVFFILLRQLTDICRVDEINFERIEYLQKKYCEILQSIESLKKLLEDENYKNSLSSMKNKNKFIDELRTELVEHLFKKCKESNDCNPIWMSFFAAAACDSEELERQINIFNCKLLSTTNRCDSILVFALKYGNISSKTNEFFECVHMLIDEGVDINKPDFYGRTAVDHVRILHERSKEDIKRKLEQLLVKLQEKNIFWELLEEETKNFIIEKFHQTRSAFYNIESDLESQPDEVIIKTLFSWIGRENIEEFVKFKKIREFSNSDNGEFTLLHYACLKSGINRYRIVKSLLDNGADPNICATYNFYSPLLFVAMDDDEQSFNEILHTEKLVISKKMFKDFVSCSTTSIKQNYFEMLLASDKLEPTLTDNIKRNTPLHYAVLLSNKNTIQKILNRGETNLLNIPNINGKTVLDTITARDLKEHFDTCIELDKLNGFGSDDYKVQLRFHSLVSRGGEVEIISKISKNPNLQHLLTHPLLHAFVLMKWSKVQFYYWLLLLYQFLFCTGVSILLFLSYDNNSLLFGSMLMILSLIGAIIKDHIFIISNLSKINFFFIFELVLHGTICLAATANISQTFAIIAMSAVLLFTAGYHPKIAKWPVIVEKVFKSFTLLLFVIFLVLFLPFVAAFYLLLKKDVPMFQTIRNSVFATYEITMYGFWLEENVTFTRPIEFILFLIFATFVTTVIVMFLTAVAVTDITTIEKDAEMNALKYVISFLKFVESSRIVRMLMNYVESRRDYNSVGMSRWNPLLFSKTNAEHSVNFYLNSENQFGDLELGNMHPECLKKIKMFCLDKIDNSNDI